MLFTAIEYGSSYGKEAATILENTFDSANYRKPTNFSRVISALASAGSYAATGGLLGTGLSYFVGLSVEPIVRKFQYEIDKQSYKELDDAQERQSLAYCEKHGYSAPGI